jgi:hypothetical protein
LNCIGGIGLDGVFDLGLGHKATNIPEMWGLIPLMVTRGGEHELQKYPTTWKWVMAILSLPLIDQSLPFYVNP